MDPNLLTQILGTVSTVWFFLFFVCMLAWVFWPSHKARMDHQAQIPLRDDEI
jgi:cbb3-type cytochrome oxidase subunit 3